TMPDAIRQLARQILKKPEQVEVGRHTSPAETVLQHACSVRQDQKMDLLLEVLRGEDVRNVLVFSRTKHRADRIVRRLGQQGHRAAVMHSNRSQGQRQRALDDFRSGRVRILVATDIAARGIDVDLISHVVNYDTPNQAEDYIHRIGRTGRAQATGRAITFVAQDEEGYLRDIERHVGAKIERMEYGG
ncbi:MAG TPA: DEAD/DEAH box helicase, partial [Rhodothermales bacterium]